MNPDTGTLEWMKQNEVDAYNEDLKKQNINIVRMKMDPSG